MTFWRDSSLVWIGTLLAAALAFTVQVLLARHLGVASFGAMTNCYAIASLIGIFGFQGVGEVIMRLPTDLRRSMVIRAFLVLFTLASLLALLTVLFVEPIGVEMGLMLAFLPFAIVHVGLLAGMVDAQIAHRSLGIAAWPALLQLGRLLGLVAVIAIGGSVIQIPLAWAIMLLVPGFLGTRFLLRRTPKLGQADSDQPQETWATVRAALPFAVTRVIEYAELQLPVVLAMAMAGAEPMAWIAAALTLLQGMLLLPFAVFQRLLRPRFHEWGKTDRPRLVRVAFAGGAIMAAIGGVMALVVRPFAGWLLDLTFGDEFQPAADFFSMVLMVLPIWFASIAVNAALVTPRDAYLRSLFQGVGVVTLALAALALSREGVMTGILIGIFLCQAILLGSGIVILLTGRHPDHTPR